MIATGGLLRINARRQDSLRSKAHKTHTHKRKTKRKRRSEVVVVKGKLKLCSVSGLVAGLGILVLLVGVVMAALGYWPRDGLFFSTRPQEGAAMASVSASGSTPAHAQGGDRGEGKGGCEGSFNRTDAVNETSKQLPRGFLVDFLDRYLYSDRLKVFGPLIMGIGIFLFICANAVLHENRDKKTKVINLRDIYSTVIDLHSLRRPGATSARCPSTSPLNGLVNYVQSKSLEAKPRACPSSLSRREGDAVFSIYPEQPDAQPLSSSHRLSLPPSFSPPHLSTWTSGQKEALTSFTLPLRRQRPPTPRRSHSARLAMGPDRGGGTGGEEEWRGEGGGHRWEEEEGVYACPSPPLFSSTPSPPRCLQGLHREAPRGSQAPLLLSSSSLTPSHLSLSSLSHLLSSPSSLPAPPTRRRSLPTTSSTAGYSKMMHKDESFESTEIMSSHHVTSQGGAQRPREVTSHRKYSDQEKLKMISQEGRPIRS